MEEAIKEVLDAGLEVSNKEGGYMRKIDNNANPDNDEEYLFQTSYRSSHYGSFESMVKDFLFESKLKE